MFQGSKAIRDPNTIALISNILQSSELSAVMHTDFLRKFELTFSDWLLAHSTNKIHGLEKFVPNFSTGTTQGFDSFYLRHRTKHFRCFVGEYFYHLKTWQANTIEWDFITNDRPIQEGDAVVISAPFCDTGSLHAQHRDLLAQCEELNIPVLIDCCYYPISGNIELDLNYNCIDTICFSLSKAFPVATMRIGMRYTREDIFDGQSLHSSINYNNNICAAIGLKVINTFSSDYIYNTYIDKQKEVCSILPGLTASNCAIFAVGDQTWDQYSRANLLKDYQLTFDPKLFTNRICLNSIYENWDLWNKYKNEYTTNI